MIEKPLTNMLFANPLNPMFAYATKGGRKVRPRILLLSYKAVGGSSEKAKAAAEAVELMHKFSLIHDDIIDRDELRRGRPSFYKKYGRNYAIFMGDYICAESFNQLRSISRENPGKAYSCYKLLSDAFYKLSLGELLDMGPCRFMTVDEYLNIAYLKSAALIEAAARMGALLGGGSEEEQEMLASFGKNFAMAMQMLNDIKDTMGEDTARGASDISGGRWNILITSAFEKAGYRDKKELLRIMNLQKRGEREIKAVRAIIKRAGSVSYAKLLAEDYFKKANQAIAQLKDSRAKKSLEALSDASAAEGYWKNGD